LELVISDLFALKSTAFRLRFANETLYIASVSRLEKGSLGIVKDSLAANPTSVTARSKSRLADRFFVL
jgi:hypothetical protein